MSKVFGLLFKRGPYWVGLWNEREIADDMKAKLAKRGDASEVVELAKLPISMILHCPECHTQHIDRVEPPRYHGREITREEWALLKKGQGVNFVPDQSCLHDPWDNPPHKTHLCQKCGFLFKPANVETTGVASLE
jgi:predicted RNA-binding Zn-ribbon protein involved in translation (DUF1610 family)